MSAWAGNAEPSVGLFGLAADCGISAPLDETVMPLREVADISECPCQLRLVDDPSLDEIVKRETTGS